MKRPAAMLALIVATLIGLSAQRALAFVHTDVVHQHELRKDGSQIGIPGPTTSYGDVQQKEEGVIEDPLGACGQSGRGYGVIQVAVDEELNGIR